MRKVSLVLSLNYCCPSRPDTIGTYCWSQ
jgi:hypothetical protein